MKQEENKGCGKIFEINGNRVRCEAYDPFIHTFNVDFFCPECQKKQDNQTHPQKNISNNVIFRKSVDGTLKDSIEDVKTAEEYPKDCYVIPVLDVIEIIKNGGIDDE